MGRVLVRSSRSRERWPALPLIGVFALLAPRSEVVAQEVPPVTLRLEGAGQVGGLPGGIAEVSYKVFLDVAPSAAGRPAEVSAWSLGVQVLGGDCRIVRASTTGTVCAPVSAGGAGAAFDDTQLTTGAQNAGAVSACALEAGTVLGPGSYPILSLTVEALLPKGEECADCRLGIVDGLRGAAEAVPLLVTYNRQSIRPAIENRNARLCPASCFENELHVLDWGQWFLGDAFGTARRVDRCYELCTVASGYGAAGDSAQLLARTADSEFQMVVAVTELAGDTPNRAGGPIAGLEARAFTGTAGNPASPYIGVYVRRSAAGGLEVASSARARMGEPAKEGEAVAVQRLPVTLRVRGARGVLTAEVSLDGGRTFERPLLTAEDSGGNHRVGMVHASGGEATSRAVFCDPELRINESTIDRIPQLSPAAIDRRSILEGKSNLEGRNLAEVVELLIGETPVDFVRDGTALLFDPRQLKPPVIADVLIRTPAGSVRIPEGFVDLGGGFVRCDCDGSGSHDITDHVIHLEHLLLGGPGCDCPNSADCNADGENNVADTIFGLMALFVGGVTVPAPYPERGPARTGEVICGVEGLPTDARGFRVVDLQGRPLRSIQAGQRFRILGEGFSRMPENNLVIAGDARLSVLEATPAELLIETEFVITDRVISDVFVGGFDIIDLSPFICPGVCQPDPKGPFLKIPLLEPIPTIRDPIGPVIGTLVPVDDTRGGAELRVSLEELAKLEEVTMAVHLPLPAIQDLSPGGITTSIQHSFGPRMTGEEKLVELTRVLRSRLRLDDTINIAVDSELGVISLEPHPRVFDTLPREIFDGLVVSFYGPPIGRCGPANLHPILDERAFAWCRIEEMVKPCGGLPAFEWWIPEQFVRSTDDNPVIPLPNARSSGMKTVMYNKPAYCHVRENELWNLCKQESFTDMAGGPTDIPPFPRAAWVLKSSWTNSLPPGADPTHFYSYTQTGTGTTFYLTALQPTTKDINNWVWMDLIPGDVQTSSIGGCGARNDDLPPGLVGTVWENYILCTNVTHTQPFVEDPGPPFQSAWCGNYQFPPECPDDGDGYDTCMNCHDGSTPGAATSGCCLTGAITTTPNGDLDLDFLFSLSNLFNSLPRVPNPCGAAPAGTDYDLDIQPIWNANCIFCHSGVGAPEGLDLTAGNSWADLVNVTASQPAPAMNRVTPNSTAASYLWHKIQGTQAGVGGSGCQMPRPCASAPLGAADKTKIQDWINDGAPN